LNPFNYYSCDKLPYGNHGEGARVAEQQHSVVELTQQSRTCFANIQDSSKIRYTNYSLEVNFKCIHDHFYSVILWQAVLLNNQYLEISQINYRPRYLELIAEISNSIRYISN